MRLVLIAVVLILGCGAAGAAAAAADFRPELAELRIEPRAVRPGDAFTLSLTFVNRGSAVAADRYRVFLHFERPRKDCRDIVFQADYEPSLPTIGWEPGKPVVEGPRTVTVPGSAAEGEYWVHIGIFDQKTGKRYADTYAGAITVDARAAPPQRALQPLPDAERARRAEAFEQRLRDAAAERRDVTGCLPAACEGAWVKPQTNASGPRTPRAEPSGWRDVFSQEDYEPFQWASECSLEPDCRPNREPGDSPCRRFRLG